MGIGVYNRKSNIVKDKKGNKTLCKKNGKWSKKMAILRFKIKMGKN